MRVTLERRGVAPGASPGRRSVRVCIGSSAQGTVTASATLKIAGVRKRVALAEASTPVKAGGTAKLRLPIPARKTRAAITKALRGNRRVGAAVKVTVSDAAGGQGVIAFQVLRSR